ncbi:MAG: polyketide synthase PksJ, partial [Cyclobacteriaceae bacterium]
SYRFVMPNELMTFNASNIGKVINKTGSLVFDNKMKLAPQGLVGNLYVAGLPVNGKLTPESDRFRKDPFGSGFMKVFETGHRARYIHDGNVEVTRENDEEIILDGKLVNITITEDSVRSLKGIKDCKLLKIKNDEKRNEIVLFYVTDMGIFFTERDLVNLTCNSSLSKLIEDVHLVQLPEFYYSNQSDISIKELEKLDITLYSDLKQIEKKHLSEVSVRITNDVFLKKPETKNITKSNTKKGEKSKRLALLEAPSLSSRDFEKSSVVDFLIKSAEIYPDNGIISIRSKERINISYHELLEKAKQVASGLALKNINTGDRVILQINKQTEFFPVFWGCVLRGAIPLVLGVPPAYEESQGLAKKIHKAWVIMEKPVIICSDKLFGDIANLENVFKMEGLKVQPISTIISKITNENDLYNSKPDDLIFFLMTSGSTGMPKCIKVNHRGALSHIFGIKQHMQLSDQDVIVNMLPIDHITPLLSLHVRGVVLGAMQVHLDISYFLNAPTVWFDAIEEFKGTHTFSPNFAYKLVTEALGKNDHNKSWDLSSIKSYKNGGELISYEVVKDFFDITKPYGTSVSTFQPAYGMTEVAGAITVSREFEIEKNTYNIHTNSNQHVILADENDDSALSFIDVGPPINGTSIRVADENSNLLNEYQIGSIQLKGNVVTTGYVNNHEAEKKVFLKEGWFKTGDLGFIADRKLIVTGRENDLLIYNGINYYSYELEFILNKIPGIESNYTAALSYSSRDSAENIAIFFTPQNKKVNSIRNTIKKAKKELSSQLGVEPEIIIPISNKEFPRTDSGKINKPSLKKRLQDNDLGDLFDKVYKEDNLNDSGYEMVVFIKEKDLSKKFEGVSEKVTIKLGDKLPENIDQLHNQNFETLTIHHDEVKLDQTQAKLLQVWKKVLNNEDIKNTSNFFELGGNSLKAIQIITRVGEGFGVDLELKDLFINPTIKGLSKLFKRRSVGSNMLIKPREEADHYELSHAQKRLWILNKQEENHFAYNMLEAYRLKGNLNLEALNKAFDRLLSRHEVLRTVFITVKGEPRQKILKVKNFKIDVRNGKAVDLESELRKEIIEPFDMENGPLIRARLFELNGQENIFLFSMHHIISDGWSFEVIISEVMSYYNQVNEHKETDILQLGIQYKDYCSWYNEVISSNLLKSSKSYWQNKLSLPIAPLDLVGSKVRPAQKSYEGKVYTFSLGAKKTEQIVTFSKRNNITLFHFYVAIIKVLLYKHTRQSDITIGAPIAGRMNYQLEEQIGFYLNNLVLRDEVIADLGFSAFQQNVSNTILEAYENQLYPFDLLVEDLRIKPHVSRNPIYDVMIVMDTERTFTESDDDFDSNLQKFLEVESIEPEYPVSKLDLTYFVRKNENQFHIDLEYRTDLIPEILIHKIASDLKILIDKVLENPKLQIKELLEATYSNHEKDEKQQFKNSVLEMFSTDF